MAQLVTEKNEEGRNRKRKACSPELRITPDCSNRLHAENRQKIGGDIGPLREVPASTERRGGKQGEGEEQNCYD